MLNILVELCTLQINITIIFNELSKLSSNTEALDMKDYEYQIDGMTCQGCVRSVESKLLIFKSKLKDMKVQLSYPQLSFQSDKDVDLLAIQQALGHYHISKKLIQPEEVIEPVTVEETISLTTYKPLFLIVLFISGVTLLAQYPFLEFSWMTWMRHFMAGFFIVFSFFKILNVTGFAQSYQMYDIIARKWYGWGHIYPFIELGLGILYLVDIEPYFTNVATIIILGVSSIGVIQSNLNKQKIQCACLGDVFNLPMSTITIIEDLAMVGMAIMMLVYMV